NQAVQPRVVLSRLLAPPLDQAGQEDVPVAGLPSDAADVPQLLPGRVAPSPAGSRRRCPGPPAPAVCPPEAGKHARGPCPPGAGPAAGGRAPPPGAASAGAEPRGPSASSPPGRRSTCPQPRSFASSQRASTAGNARRGRPANSEDLTRTAAGFSLVSWPR